MEDRLYQISSLIKYHENKQICLGMVSFSECHHVLSSTGDITHSLSSAILNTHLRVGPNLSNAINSILFQTATGYCCQSFLNHIMSKGFLKLQCVRKQGELPFANVRRDRDTFNQYLRHPYQTRSQYCVITHVIKNRHI